MVERCIAETEDAMLKLRSPHRVHEYIGRKWKIEKRQVQRYMEKVRAKWREQAARTPTPELREQRRDYMRATLDHMIHDSLMRTEVVKDADGNPLLDDREFLADGSRNPNYKRPVTRPAPDRRAALYALRLLKDLDGLDEPVKSQVEVLGLADKLPDLDSIPNGPREHLVAALEAMAPDGDLRKLAGELFVAGARANKLN